MDVVSIPAEVVDAYVLPFLKWNDLLRLRRVCTWTKDIVDAYLKVHPELAPEIEISENGEGKSFADFLKMGIPTTKIFLNNTSGDKIYEEAGEDGVKFLERFGPWIRSLRLDQLSFVIIGKELEFLDGLKNLESLEATRYGGYKRGISPEEAADFIWMKISISKEDPNAFREGKIVFPKIFTKRLKSLRIGNNDDAVYHDLFDWINCFLDEGTALNSIALPFNNAEVKLPSTSNNYRFRDQPLVVQFRVLLDYITWRSQHEPPLAKFKEIDFMSNHSSDHDALTQSGRNCLASPFFIALCCVCVNHGVKLLNVDSSWFIGKKHMNLSAAMLAHIGMPIKSAVNMHPDFFLMNMPNLERIEIKSTSQSSPGSNWMEDRPDWPSLRALDINVDSRESEYFQLSDQNRRPILYSVRTMELFHFFFRGVVRISLSDLRLEFSEEADAVAIPKTEDIVSGCPNLKKLALINWPKKNKALIKLWAGLPGLEEVSLENCKALGNVSFVGEDVRSPVFLRLTKLKRLSLKGLDKMPKVTDTLFTLVIRHLKLTHLTLTSDGPMKSITEAGIRSLSGGRFADSIEKFPFKDWSLSEMSAEEFGKLESTFRSFDMI